MKVNMINATTNVIQCVKTILNSEFTSVTCMVWHHLNYLKSVYFSDSNKDLTN